MVLEGWPWPEISTSTMDFVCKRVLKGVRGLSWSENVDGVFFMLGGVPGPKMWTPMLHFFYLL